MARRLRAYLGRWRKRELAAVRSREVQTALDRAVLHVEDRYSDRG